MNNTMKSYGLAASLLFFGVLPRFKYIQNDIPNQKDRKTGSTSARNLEETKTSELHIKGTQKLNIPASCYVSFKPQEEDLVHI